MTIATPYLVGTSYSSESILHSTMSGPLHHESGKTPCVKHRKDPLIYEFSYALLGSKNTILATQNHENRPFLLLPTHGSRIAKFGSVRLPYCSLTAYGGKTTRITELAKRSQQLRMFKYASTYYTTRG